MSLLLPLQGDLGLNICEAHAFNTKDRFSLDVFVVNGWAGGGTEELEDVLSRRLQELPPPVVRGASASPPASAQEVELRVPQDELDALAKVRRSWWAEGKNSSLATMACTQGLWPILAMTCIVAPLLLPGAASQHQRERQ